MIKWFRRDKDTEGIPMAFIEQLREISKLEQDNSKLNYYHTNLLRAVEGLLPHAKEKFKRYIWGCRMTGRADIKAEEIYKSYWSDLNEN